MYVITLIQLPVVHVLLHVHTHMQAYTVHLQLHTHTHIDSIDLTETKQPITCKEFQGDYTVKNLKTKAIGSNLAGIIFSLEERI